MNTARAIGNIILRHPNLKIWNEPDIILESIQEYYVDYSTMYGLCWYFMVLLDISRR
jgi:hypothetical protein